MDPLSIPASIAGLVTLADIIYGRINKYVKAVKNAPNDIAALSAEIRNLYGILSNLRLTAEHLEQEHCEWTTRVHHLDSCHQLLKRVDTILGSDEQASYPDVRLKMKHRLRWPFKSSEVHEIIAEIQRHKATLGLALNADGVIGLLRALSKQSDMDNDIKSIKTELSRKREADIRVALNEKRQNVLDSFGTIDPRRNLDMNRRLRHPNTGLWFVDSSEFQHWLAIDNARLWVCGIPGAGKTVLASLVIDEALQKTSPNVAAAYFYCDYKDSMTQQSDKILSCIVQQLAKQDEQSFAKVESFHRLHSKDRRNPIEYDPKDLCHLIIELSTNYDCTMVIVDGLDECGTNVSLVVELLNKLHNNERESNVKTLLLSRDEPDIRENLEDYTMVSIAARSSDLSLYVNAEIETRTRKKKLIIKSPDLKERIRNKLTDGADGIQMDYLCELPNDRARHNALNDLPRGLVPTYERLLRRVNTYSEPIQTLVQRTLKWVAFDAQSLSTEQLREAVSINIGDTCRDSEAFSDVSEILRRCSSLIRLSADGQRFEFAHFTVKEFLQSIDHTSRGEFAAYSIESRHLKTKLAKVCFTYLNFQEFNEVSHGSVEAIELRLKEFPFRGYVTRGLWGNIHGCDWGDIGLSNLAKTFFSPSKPSTLISYFQDYLYCVRSDLDYSVDFDKIAEATTLHFAAMFRLPTMCKWLVESKCDVNSRTSLGTPLHCALLGPNVLDIKGFRYDSGDRLGMKRIFKNLSDATEVVNIILEAGADPNLKYATRSGSTSPLWVAVHYQLLGLEDGPMQRLLQGGATVDEEVLNLILDRDGGIRTFKTILAMTDTTKILCGGELRARALKYALENRVPMSSTVLLPSKLLGKEQHAQSRQCEASLRTGAEFGQPDVCRRLLDDYSIWIDAEEEETLCTALHFAASNDHLEVCQLLVERGASINTTDQMGKTALHHCMDGNGLRCFSWFLPQCLDTTTCDVHNLTIWHRAAHNHNIEALNILIRHCNSKIPLEKLEREGMPSLLSCAAEQQNDAEAEETVSFLLENGCKSWIADHYGRTALHNAAKTGLPGVIRLLIAHGAIADALSHDRSNAIHYAMTGDCHKIDEILDVLIEGGVSPFDGREDGRTPIQLLLGDEADGKDDSTKLKALRSLAEIPASSEGKKEGLTQALGLICGHRLHGRSDPDWLLRGLELLLENGADLTGNYDTESTPLDILAGNSPYDSKQDIRIVREERDAYDSEEDIEITREERDAYDSEEDIEITREGRDAEAPLWGRLVLAALDHIPPYDVFPDTLSRPELLLSAIKTSNDKLIQRLIDYSPDVDKLVPAQGESPIEYACRTGCSSISIAKLLHRSRALLDKSLGAKLVRSVCQQASLDSQLSLLELLKAGLDPDGPSAKGETALMFAARAGSIHMVDLLLSYGSNPKAIDCAGCTIAHYATSTNRLEVLEVLRGTPVDWNAKADTTKFGLYRSRTTLLHLGISHHDGAILRYLLDKDLIEDINEVNELNETALHLSAEWNEPTYVSLLLSNGADPTIADHKDDLPIHIAAYYDRADVLLEIMNRGYNLRIPNGKGLNCEMIAWKCGHTKLAKMLGQYEQEQGKDRDLRDQSPTLGALSNSGKASEPLKIAINLGDLDLCKRIVEDGAGLNLEFQDCAGCTPLLVSLLRKQPAIAKYFVLQGASPAGTICDAFNPLGYSAFHLAALYNLTEILEILVDHHPKRYLDLQHAVHPLHVALVAESLDCVDLILRDALERGTSLLSDALYALDFEGYRPMLCHSKSDSSEVPMTVKTFTPLVIAVNTGNYEITSRLLDFGAPTNEVNLLGWTPLHLAIFNGSQDIVELLLKNGANLDTQGENIETPLHVAARNGDELAVELLLRYQANIHSRNRKLQTPLMFAAAAANITIVQSLFARGIYSQERDCMGATYLHYAATSGKIDVMSYCLSEVAVDLLDLEDIFGHTGLSNAMKCFDFQSTALLNIAPRSAAYYGQRNNIITSALSNRTMTSTALRMLFRRLPQGLLQTLLEHRAQNGGTPLYAASTITHPRLQPGFIKQLLDAGANLDADGGDYGSPLMGACATGRLSAVKCLVQNQASLSYTRDGQHFSALRAAEHFPEIVRWLLVGRFREGPKLLTAPRL